MTEVQAARSLTLAEAYAVHPERFAHCRSGPAELPDAVWIKPPAKEVPTR